MNTPTTLDHDGIAARVPHAGTMCLLQSLQAWSVDSIHCTARDHTGRDHPLRGPGGLSSVVGIEYAAQAMALHAGLCATAAADATGSETRPPAGFLASARSVVMHVAHLDAASAPLQVHAERLAGDERQAMYRFHLQCARGQPLLEGRATVVLDPGPPPPPPRTPS
jgi:predicted hotdog family 3-hydroxylacyl-ACP dehydratase